MVGGVFERIVVAGLYRKLKVAGMRRSVLAEAGQGHRGDPRASGALKQNEDHLV